MKTVSRLRLVLALLTLGALAISTGYFSAIFAFGVYPDEVLPWYLETTLVGLSLGGSLLALLGGVALVQREGHRTGADRILLAGGLLNLACWVFWFLGAGLLL